MLNLLTMTGGRPEAFALCQKWMARQTYQGEVNWIIVDDGPEKQEVTFKKGWKYTVVHPIPIWKPGQNTQARNIQAGLRTREWKDGDKLVIIEDDDWYSPHWLQVCADALDKCDLFGESLARYYSVARRTGRQLSNTKHSSLCSTAMKKPFIDILAKLSKPGIQFIDLGLWRARSNQSKVLSPTHNVVGIKGLPGRTGIGIGHREAFNGTFDYGLELLHSWVGEDFEDYRGYYVAR